MNIQTDVSLAAFTTLQVGGLARWFVSVTSVEELEQARQFALQTAAPVLVIGSGSNLFIRDAGFAGVVIHNQIMGRDYAPQSDGSVLATIGSGELLDEVIADTVTRGLWGLENLSHIPGTVGATPVQNVGAYGVEVSQLITAVTAVYLQTGERKTFTNTDCQFAYRDSFFKTAAGSQWCITSVTFRLQQTPRPVLTYKDLASLQGDQQVSQQVIRDTVIYIRAQKFPDWTTVGTAGSFFKNPIIPVEQVEQLVETYPDLPTYPVTDEVSKVSLGYILDKICHLKGYERDQVRLFENQALVLVNEQQSAQVVEAFAAEIAKIVKEKTGITIEQEVRTV